MSVNDKIAFIFSWNDLNRKRVSVNVSLQVIRSQCPLDLLFWFWSQIQHCM